MQAKGREGTRAQHVKEKDSIGFVEGRPGCFVEELEVVEAKEKQDEQVGLPGKG